jgi:P2-related tail formation protein
MLELIFLTCTFTVHSTDVPDCHVRRIPIVEEDPVTPHQCMASALPKLAEWSESHPGWWIKKWTCHRVDKNKADI